MAARSVDLAGPRFAVVGATGPDGSRVRAALAQAGIPGDRVDLFGAAEGEAVLSEYGGEARLVQDESEADFDGYDGIYLCTGGEVAARVRASARGRVFDFTGEGRPGAAPAGARSDGEDAWIEIPHFLSLFLVSILGPVNARLGVRRAVMTILRPASDFGDAGLEELREQVVRLLRFEQAPTEVFGRQLAFNLLPQGLLRGSERGLEARVEREVAQALHPARAHLSVRIVTVPVFYGHGIAMHLQLEKGDARALAAVVGEIEGARLPADDTPGSPMDLLDTRAVAFHEIADDGEGCIRLWAVASDASPAAAELAARRAAERLRT